MQPHTLEEYGNPDSFYIRGAAQLMATSAAASKGRSRQAMARVSATGDVSLHHTKQLPALCVAVADGFASAGHYNCTATVESWDFTYSEVRLHGSVDVALKNSAWEVSRPRMRFHFSVMEFELVLKKKYEAKPRLSNRGRDAAHVGELLAARIGTQDYAGLRQPARDGHLPRHALGALRGLHPNRPAR
ncbi:hypothetical protein HPB48_005262 [Haemaphysalis longicornis]|uniref:Uncharacterized protein n=1 Tax=Haemaphysalis longicornis TaxID=44386 RepID=A0A9J6FMB8_HAELO|nr:hypothetical protein HPB48_005262 [Haemaphysalis longicornis]